MHGGRPRGFERLNNCLQVLAAVALWHLSQVMPTLLYHMPFRTDMSQTTELSISLELTARKHLIFLFNHIM